MENPILSFVVGLYGEMEVFKETALGNCLLVMDFSD
jgi:hypothetical protein